MAGTAKGSSTIVALMKSVVPSRLHPVARRWYSSLSSMTWSTPLIPHSYGTLPVLRCRIAYNRYGAYCVPLSSGHRPAVRKILSGDVFEPETLDFMRAHCGAGDIVHAGTYFGDFLPALSGKCAPGAQIWAFEPNRENYRCAQITLLLNGLENVELTNAGLGERRHLSNLVTGDRSGRGLGGGSHLVEGVAGDPAATTEVVEVVTVDETVPANREVSMIQLDVEWHERQVLSGALATIRRCLPILILENLPDQAWLAENILPLGYRVTRKLHVNTVLLCDRR